MTQWIFGGLAGLFLGMMWRISGLFDPQNLRSALALRPSAAAKTALAALGWGLMLLALMMYLAVMDTDLLEVPPLSWATLLGAMLLGAGMAAGGFTPLTALAGVGGGRFPEGVCACIGVLAGTLLVPYVRQLAQGLSVPIAEGTLFQVTLFAPWHWPGRFLGLGALGALVLVLAAYLPLPEKAPLLGLPAPKTPPEPEKSEESADILIDADADTVIAVLPGEEVLVVDTAEQAEEAEESGESTESEEIATHADADTVIAALPGEEVLVVDTAEQAEDAEESEESEEAAPSEETPGMTEEAPEDTEEEDEERSEEP